MKFLRTLGRIVLLGASVAQALCEYTRLRGMEDFDLNARADWLHRWCATALRRLGVGYAQEGVPSGNTLLVSNHLSYLDILVFSAILPCIFVAKKEVAGWAVFGRMARLSGTIFVDRGRRADVHRVSEQISQAVQSGVTVVVFAEGTSSDGITVLPFYSSLLEPAVMLAIPVTPAHISYSVEDGDPRTDICWWGDMTLIPHALKMFSKRDIRSKIRFGGPQTYQDRKRAAAETRMAVMRLGGRTLQQDSGSIEMASDHF